MSRQITIRNKLYARIREIKGDGSYSDGIETLIKNYDAVVEPSKVQTTAASTPQQEARSTDNA